MIEAASAAEVPAAVAGYLRSTNLPLRVRVGNDAYLDALPWKSEPALERKRGPAAGDDEVGLSHAAAAVAETGTLVLASGADNPVTITFLPETSIVVVRGQGPGRRLRGGVGEGARPLRGGRHAAHGQFRVGAVAHGRHRRAIGDGRAWAATVVRGVGAGLISCLPDCHAILDM